MKQQIFKATFICFLFFVAGCKKGETGPTGPAGANGTNGNANVTSQVFSVSSWTDAGSGYMWYTNLTVPALTATVQDQGTVELFLSTDNGQHWKALPFTSFGNAPNANMVFETSINNVKIEWYEGFGNSINDPNAALGACQFKVVVIPPA